MPVWVDGIENISRCPRRPIFENPAYFDEVLGYYSPYKAHGLLPEDGGLNYQPSKYIETMRVIGAAISECDEIEKRSRS